MSKSYHNNNQNASFIHVKSDIYINYSGRRPVA